MIRTVSILAFLVLALGMGAATTGCNTIEGLGEDVSAAARGVKRSVFKSN